METDHEKGEKRVGLFFKSSKAREEEQRLREIRKNRERIEAERKAGMAATRAYQQEHKEELQAWAQAGDEVAALVRDDRVLICGPSRFAIMMEHDRLRDAKEVVEFLSKDPAEIGNKCRETEPSWLLLLYNEPDLAAFARKILEVCPSVMILAVVKAPEALSAGESQLRQAHVMGVAKCSCKIDEFAQALKKVKQASGQPD